jgi:hypothetical protein
MGMSASQARYLSLIAQQSNLEYQGQQINQERSILSQQVAELYNNLLALEVPTPPTTTEFTRIEYTGSDGASKFQVGQIKPSGQNYCVEMKRTLNGAGLSKEYGKSVVSIAPDTIKGKTVDTTDYTGAYSATEDGGCVMRKAQVVAGNTLEGDYYTLVDGKYTKTTDTVAKENVDYYELVPYNEELAQDGDTRVNPDEGQRLAGSIGNYYILREDGTLRHAKESDFDKQPDGTYKFKVGVNYIEQDPNGTEYANPDKGKTTIAGRAAMSWAEFEESEGYDENYAEAIKNTFGDEADSIKPEDFMVYKMADGTYRFAMKTDVMGSDGYAESYTFGTGSYTTSEWVDNCQLTFDTSGRVTSIDVPVINDGEIVSYQTIALTAVEVTDENAYNDAMAEYEYKQYLYDQEQKEINYETARIQEMDRNLELKLTRLDTQRKQITTEIDALKKVLDENIEKSYKTFSG